MFYFITGCVNREIIINQSKTYNNPPTIKINNKNPFIGEFLYSYDSDGEADSSYLKTVVSSEKEFVTVCFAKPTSEFRNETPDLIDLSDNYSVSVDYCKNDFTIEVYYSLLLNIDEPYEQKESSWVICIDWNNLFGIQRQLELKNFLFSLNRFDENIKYFGIRINFYSPTFGSARLGFLIQNSPRI